MLEQAYPVPDLVHLVATYLTKITEIVGMVLKLLRRRVGPLEDVSEVPNVRAALLPALKSALPRFVPHSRGHTPILPLFLPLTSLVPRDSRAPLPQPVQKGIFLPQTMAT